MISNRFILLVLLQHSKLRDLKREVLRKLQWVSGGLSLVISLGIIQLFVSGQSFVAQKIVSAELMNRCTPEAVTHSTATLKGVGFANWVIGFQSLFLSMTFLTIAIWWFVKIWNLEQIRPHHKADLLAQDESGILEYNRNLISQAKQKSRMFNSRLIISFIFGFHTVVLVLLNYFNAVWIAISYVTISIIFGMAIVIWSVYMFYKGIRKPELGGIVLGYFPIIALLLLILFSLYHYKGIYALINYFYIC